MAGKKHNKAVKYGGIGVILILIILILAYIALFILPVNNGLSPYSKCITSNKYSCSSTNITGSGVLDFTFTQNIGKTEYNTTLYLTTLGSNITNSNHTVSTYLGSVTPGQNVMVTIQIKPDMLVSGKTVTYLGSVWLSYSNTNNSPPNITTKVAQITVSSSS